MLKDAPDFGVSTLQEIDLEKEFGAKMKHDYSPVRYWAMMQLLGSENKTVYAKNEALVVKALKDSEPIVAVAAAECLGTHSNNKDYQKNAVNTLMEYAAFPGNELFLTVHALNALEHLRDQGIELPKEAAELTQKHPDIPRIFDYYRPQIIERF